MSQLIMRWKNDHTSVSPIEVPSNCKIVNFTELNSAIDKWLDIVQYGLSDGKKGPDYYHNTMTALSFYNEDKCFFILENEKAVATITVVCDYNKKVGVVHMVACREDARGKGYGTLLTKIAEYTLKKEGMESAYLTTDDWRIPAIKSYLRIGFYPDLSNDDFINRWDLIYKQIRR